MKFLRKYIRAVLLEEVDQNPDPDGDDKKDQPPENLLIEPDLPEESEEDRKEVSTVAAAGAPSGDLRGSTSPLGRKAPYPKKKKKKKHPAASRRSN